MRTFLYRRWKTEVVNLLIEGFTGNFMGPSKSGDFLVVVKFTFYRSLKWTTPVYLPTVV